MGLVCPTSLGDRVASIILCQWCEIRGFCMSAHPLQNFPECRLYFPCFWTPLPCSMTPCKVLSSSSEASCLQSACSSQVLIFLSPTPSVLSSVSWLLASSVPPRATLPVDHLSYRFLSRRAAVCPFPHQAPHKVPSARWKMLFCGSDALVGGRQDNKSSSSPWRVLWGEVM